MTITWVTVLLLVLGVAAPLGWHLMRRSGSEPQPSSSEVAAAERRWRALNAAARAAGCRCGQPATEVRYDTRNVGSVPVETWTCTEHVGAEMWVGSQPFWGHDRPLPGVTPAATSTRNADGVTQRWFYPVKPSEAGRR
ncbi:hypothetical protein [Verrucosispora sp. WMMC514]|uniref:hypothetical protein n=1 Tax=Verrucosispora sp. WMMC514 TaxID=3015156 RepID=UPI00248D1271|nr:hypothetical protein [Verrucosispora sp. WMMC514]WBB94115.1 hypothetical protein O7597_14800 [Verrucosispora sp. WMMC514]